jgi:hypothetical protein
VKRGIIGSALLLILTACATTAVDMTEPRRVVGTENAVRIDAQVSGDQVAPGAQIPITYEITNQRSTAIAVAELIPETTYDAESHTFTVSIGSEVPGNTMLPRLIAIAPGEKKTFSALARVVQFLPPRELAAQVRVAPAELRLKLNFLGDTEPFHDLIGIPQAAVSDPTLADKLFPLWLERNEVVYTNAVPMHWTARPRDPNDVTVPRAPGRRRGGG